MIASTYLLSYMEMGWVGLGSGIVLFFKFALGGLIVGAAFGLIASYIIKTIDDYPFEITISLLVFFGSFFTAELIHVSGVISVVTAGLIFGNFGGAIGMSDVTKLNINSFWEVIAFIANSLIFLMVGLEVNRIDLTGKWGMILIAIIIVILSRSISVYASLLLVKTVPLKYKHILNWGGLKGSLSIALALSLPYDFTGRDDVLVLALSVVLFSLIGQGLTIKPLIMKLGIISNDERIIEYETMIAQMYRYQKAIASWGEMKENSFLSDQVYMELKNKYETKRDELQKQLEYLYEQCPEIKESQVRRAERNSLYTEYQAIKDLINREIISGSVGKKHKQELIDKIEDIESY
ncbi:cation:proton antiporter [Alkalihalobacillus sp. BA299]|uniref:cation:proton antiporter n=1 Tax=Alkalihalobacillus sp. BA299 TaxID=2815938 RepID=UPI0027DE8EA4|nr:cation:proton antiporter [Alkalihalobacillus sp. BA299]